MLARVAILACLMSVTSGCKLLHWIRPTPKPEPIVQVLPDDATLDEITDHLNSQRASILGWKSTKVRIEPTGKILSPKLTGNLTVEGPKNLRLVAESILGPEVDFGSNSERFWFWVKRSDPKYVLTGSHAGLAKQSAVQMPFPPEWLMEALGVVPIDTTDVQMLRNPEESKVKMVSSKLIQGQQVQRVMIVDLSIGQIVEHALFDSENRLIARATMSRFLLPSGVRKYDAAGNEIRLPHTVALSWPQAEMELTMKFEDIELNPKVLARQWEMISYPGYEVMDLDEQNRQ
jgi:hypothetical protein